MKPQPRIVYIIGSMREGGAEGQLVHMARGLHRRGWPVAIMLLHYEGVRLAELEKEGIEVFAVNLPRFRPRWSPLPWLRMIGAWRRSRRFLREFKPDVIHAWLFWAHVWAAMLVYTSRIPFITSRRNTWSDKRGSRLMHRVEAIIEKRADAIVANSRAGARATDKRFRSKVRVISNAVDLAVLDAAPAADLHAEFPALSETDFIAIYVANVLPHKNHEALIRAWKRVEGRRPGAGLLCVGKDGGRMTELQSLALRLGMKSVVFASSRTDVASLIKGADFAVHASLDEGLSNAILEYMSCGKAVVATDVGGNAELIRDGESGYLVPSVESTEFHEMVIAVVDDMRLRLAMGLEGRRFIETRFSLDGATDAHARVYTAAIGRRRRR